MLPAAHRLHRSDELRAVVRRGQRLTTPQFVLHVQRTDEPTRFAVVVSKAVGNAVQRNMVKRRLREAARPMAERWPVGMDVVIRARPSAAAASFAVLARRLETTLDAWCVKEKV